MKWLLTLILLFSCTRTFSPNEKYYNAFKLDPSFYGENIIVLISPPEDVRNLDTTVNFNEVDGVTLSDGGLIVVWLSCLPTTDEEWSVVHHELFHAAYEVMDWIGIPLTPQTEEAYAYMIGYITNEFYKKIKRQEWTVH